MAILSSLSRSQKEAVGLLQVGTFLEYFDLMLYVHMAVLLNDLFFPKTDPKTASVLTAFAFCSTYLLRPFGALFFGYIGDHLGRKTTVIMTTMIMAISCIIMATLPTYAQIGISAAWLVTLCRVAQGLSSMGEVIGAEIYVTEITKPPVRYPAVGLIACASRIGTVVALGVAMLVTTQGFNWRNGFWIGAAIAVVGSVARTRLRETQEFVDMKGRINRAIKEVKERKLEKADKLMALKETLDQQPVNWKTMSAYFAIASGTALSLYFNYIYCGDLLKRLGFSPEAIIYQNFIVSMIEFVGMGGAVFLSYRIHPMKILKFRALLYLPFVCIFPFLLSNSPTASTIFFIQVIGAMIGLGGVPGVAVLVAHFPVFKRFTYISFMYAVSRSLMAVVTSFGLVYLTDYLGSWGLYLILLPVTLSFLWGVTQYEKLENLTQKPFLRSLFDWKSMPPQSSDPIFDRSLNYQKVAEK
ncbi:MAG: MFS transporter [Alphaproteobacteria bacterium 16-39-46]|nr:MAG: MFS transporter [Alphaproteobacteria bacterium 16-39-46]OZA43135.1 MAG: MFS transporter [Alphaproteobacteria bacterium 17-39-52]HQS84974.1 MFS transporter [Alphaproteobacteria bacterium]HQS93620.1 MFS transporter [Alphaproteobacteria bacterium]